MKKVLNVIGYFLYVILGSWLPHYQLGHTWVISKKIRAFCCKLLFAKTGKNIDIGRFCKLNSNIEIGDNSGIGDRVYISGNIKIGKNVMMGPEAMLIATNHNIEVLEKPMNEQGESSKGIIIEDNVWIGARAIILDGVTIKSGSVIGAGAVVTKNTEENSVMGGGASKENQDKGEKMINVLMVGVGKKRVGGMKSVADIYRQNKKFNKSVNLEYIPTSTNGTILTRFLYMIVGYIRIILHLLFNKTDIVHIHMAEKGSTFRKGFVVKISKNFHKKVIVHLHAGPFMNWYSLLSQKNQTKVVEIFNSADSVIALGDYWKKELSTIISDKKITVIYNGTTLPKKNPYKLDSKNITYFGVLRKEKGTYDLVDAIELIDAKLDPKMQVLLCGNDLEGDFSKIIEKKKLSHRIKMLGWVSDEERKKILTESALNILPSYYEGLSMTIIEGISYGVPTITTDISTMPEILGNYKYFIKPGDKKTLAKHILKLIETPKERKAISEYEFIRAKNIFSEEKFISNTLMLYNNIMGSKK